MPEVIVLTANAIARVRSWQLALEPPTALGTITGAPWPTRVGTSGGDVLCLGPSDWIVISDRREGGALVRELEAAAAGADLCIADVTQSLCGVAVHEPPARDLLSKGCGLDLHRAVFTPGMCTRTRLAGIVSIVHCADDGRTFRCFVARSHLLYVVDWLTDAAVELSTPSPPQRG